MRRKKTPAPLRLLFVCAAPALFANPPEFRSIRIPRISSPARLEEFLIMELPPRWKDKVAKVDQLTQRIPTGGALVSQRTEIYLGYDDKNLYAVFVCFDTEPQKIRARLSRRDDIFDDDTVEIILDTFNDHRRAYAFNSNPLGVQADALWTEGSDFAPSFVSIPVLSVAIEMESRASPPSNTASNRILICQPCQT
jgi:hypothetical protein